MSSEILVLPFFGQGHLFPSMELCRQLPSRNYKAIFIISSNLTSSVPSSLRDNPSIEIAEIPSDSVPPPPPQDGADSADPRQHFHRRHQQMTEGIEGFLTTRYKNSSRPVCAVIDVMMGWSKDVFIKFDIPTVAFFTSGACSAALELGAWKANAGSIQPGETRFIDGLPEEMGLTYLDLKRRPGGPPHLRGNGGPPGGPGAGSAGPRKGSHPGFPGPPPPGGADPGFPGLPPPDGTGPGFPGSGIPGGPKRFGPPAPGEQPPWLSDSEGTVALLMNTCAELEGPFIDYVAKQTGKPVWGVGPLLPEQYWKSAGSILRDREIRSKRQSNYTEDEVIEWLDSKPTGSVIYVSFGSEVGPSVEELGRLAEALEESKWPFIWVIQPNSGRQGPPRSFTGGQPGSEEEGYFPHGLDSRVGKRGLIIRGWAPQLLILSHPSTGGFLSHCGWNSTVEALGRGVPFLTWPIRGDQYFNAKLVVGHLKIGYTVATGDLSETTQKEDIVNGIEKLMSDQEIKRRAATLKSKFEIGFPASSVVSLDAFGDFVCKLKHE